jgi:hypothetical protein
LSEKSQQRAYSQIVAQVADALCNYSTQDDWIPVWRLVRTIDMRLAQQVRALDLVLPGAANLTLDAIRNKLLDAAIEMLVGKGRAEQRLDCEVEDVKFLSAVARRRNARHRRSTREERFQEKPVEVLATSSGVLFQSTASATGRPQT